MATLSRNTIGMAVRVLAKMARTEIVLFLYENDVPNEVAIGDSKLELAFNVFQSLDRPENHGYILRLIEQLLPRLSDERQNEIRQCLQRDGFVVDGPAIVDTELDAGEQRLAVIALIEKYNADLDGITLSHHLSQCEDLFRQERWDSSISHCRNFVEQLLKDIGTVLSGARKESPQLTRAVVVRDYLESIGFFDSLERRRLVDGVYAYFSEEGSHPGISTHSAARISRSVLLAFAFYVLEKFDAWKSGGLALR